MLIKEIAPNLRKILYLLRLSQYPFFLYEKIFCQRNGLQNDFICFTQIIFF